jgi:hypothetical protein
MQNANPADLRARGRGNAIVFLTVLGFDCANCGLLYLDRSYHNCMAA